MEHGAWSLKPEAQSMDVNHGLVDVISLYSEVLYSRERVSTFGVSVMV